MIYVAAPTHIVCSEVFEALKDVPGMPLISPMTHCAVPSEMMALALSDWMCALFYTAIVAIEYRYEAVKNVNACRNSFLKDDTVPQATEPLKQKPMIDNAMYTHKKRIGKFTKEIFNDYRDQYRVKYILEPGVAGKGFYKMDWLMQYGLHVEGNILELGGGTGGLTQRLLKEKLVKHVTTLVFRTYEKGEATRHNRFKVFEHHSMKAYEKKHRLVIGDVHMDEYEDAKDGVKVRFDCSLYGADGGVTCLIIDIGESKTNPTEQMEYSQKKRENFEKIYHNVGRPTVVVYKELCPWDFLRDL